MIGIKEGQEGFSKWLIESEDNSRLFKPYNYKFPVKSDGSFEVKDVIPGFYLLNGSFTDSENDNLFNGGDLSATAYSSFMVPEIIDGQSDIPMDLGDIAVTLVPNIHVGGVMPPLSIQTAVTAEFKDYLGKVVVFCHNMDQEKLDKFLSGLVNLPGAPENLVILNIDTLNVIRSRQQSTPRSHMIVDCFISSDEWSQFLSRYQIRSMMHKFVLDREGKILAMSQDEKEIIEAVKKGLAQ
jgi:hypothetical protein